MDELGFDNRLKLLKRLGYNGQEIIPAFKGVKDVLLENYQLIFHIFQNPALGVDFEAANYIHTLQSNLWY